MQKTILITGGAGFIGSHVIRRFVNSYPEYQIINLDLLTYAGNLENLSDIDSKPNYTFVKGDITDTELVNRIFENHKVEGVIHLAAESHVDRSITDPAAFIRTNIFGTFNLVHAAKEHWKNNMEGRRFYHISTDKYTDPWERQVFLLSLLRMIQRVLIQPPKPAQITWSGPISIHLICRY
jgi:dTDP-glucose 4,6-dehydratase